MDQSFLRLCVFLLDEFCGIPKARRCQFPSLVLGAGQQIPNRFHALCMIGLVVATRVVTHLPRRFVIECGFARTEKTAQTDENISTLHLLPRALARHRTDDLSRAEVKNLLQLFNLDPILFHPESCSWIKAS